MPRVSVCIPTYNTARYLPETIESVLAQDFDDYELVICDNASTDSTPELCRGYTDSRVRYLRFDEQTNQAGNFNRCLREARGDFVTLLHADDFFLPGFLADRTGRLDEDPELGFVFGAVRIVDAVSQPVSIKTVWDEDRAFGPGELIDSLVLSCLVCPPSLMVRRSAAEAVGGFRADLTWGHDWEWTLRLAEKYAAHYASPALAAYRVHDASGTAEVLSAAKNGYQERRILHETFERLAAHGNGLNGLRRRAFGALSLRHMFFAEQALFEGRKAVARNNLRYAALADLKMLTRPTFWALLLGSAGPKALYSQYRTLRDAAATKAEK